MYTQFHYKLYNSAFQLSEYEIYLLKKIDSLLIITLIHILIITLIHSIVITIQISYKLEGR